VALVWTLLGVGVIALALRDIFDVLFHPAGHAVVARWIIRGVRAMAARLPGPRSGLLVGPISYILVVAGWAALLAVGWALVWMPQMPEGFTFARDLDPAHHSGFIDALYVSLVNLTSLGYGDIAPAAAPLRILGPLETLFGLGLLTASISWLISIYNAISRRDALADEVHLARETEERLGEGDLVDGLGVGPLRVVADAERQVADHDLLFDNLGEEDHPKATDRGWQVFTGTQLFAGYAQTVIGRPRRLGRPPARGAGTVPVDRPPLLTEQRREAQLLLGHGLTLAVWGEHVRPMLRNEVLPLLVGQLPRAVALAEGLQGRLGLAEDHELALPALLGDDEIPFEAAAHLDVELLLHHRDDGRAPVEKLRRKRSRPKPAG
jgi:hypothetical protein